MTVTARTLRLGTRRSALALAQSGRVADARTATVNHRGKCQKTDRTLGARAKSAHLQGITSAIVSQFGA